MILPQVEELLASIKEKIYGNLDEGIDEKAFREYLEPYESVLVAGILEIVEKKYVLLESLISSYRPEKPLESMAAFILRSRKEEIDLEIKPRADFC